MEYTQCRQMELSLGSKEDSTANPEILLTVGNELIQFRRLVSSA
jgi:hypothetical protein